MGERSEPEKFCNTCTHTKTLPDNAQNLIMLFPVMHVLQIPGGSRPPPPPFQPTL